MEGLDLRRIFLAFLPEVVGFGGLVEGAELVVSAQLSSSAPDMGSEGSVRSCGRGEGCKWIEQNEYYSVLKLELVDQKHIIMSGSQPFSAHLEHFNKRETDSQMLQCFDMLVLHKECGKICCFAFCLQCSK